MGNPELIRKLREQTGSIEQNEREFWKAPFFPSGVAKGIIVELKGNAQTEWLLEFFKMHSENFIFWCDKEPKLNPTAVHQRGVKLPRIKFVNTEKDLSQVLRIAFEGGKYYPFLVAPTFSNDVKVLQRFHLLAQKSKSTLFLQTQKQFCSAWPISLQLEINSFEKELEVIPHRQKHGISV